MTISSHTFGHTRSREGRFISARTWEIWKPFVASPATTASLRSKVLPSINETDAASSDARRHPGPPGRKRDWHSESLQYDQSGRPISLFEDRVRQELERCWQFSCRHRLCHFLVSAHPDALMCFDPFLLPSSDSRRMSFTTCALGFNFDCRCGPCKMMEPKYVEFSEVSAHDHSTFARFWTQHSNTSLIVRCQMLPVDRRTAMFPSTFTRSWAMTARTRRSCCGPRAFAPCHPSTYGRRESRSKRLVVPRRRRSKTP